MIIIISSSIIIIIVTITISMNNNHYLRSQLRPISVLRILISEGSRGQERAQGHFSEDIPKKGVVQCSLDSCLLLSSISPLKLPSLNTDLYWLPIPRFWISEGFTQAEPFFYFLVCSFLLFSYFLVFLFSLTQAESQS